MSKKSSSVNLKNSLKKYEDISEILLNFKNKLDRLNKNSYTIAVSGGADSLALVALAKAYSCTKKVNFKYVLVNHNIRKNSKKEANQVKNLLKKNNINLVIISNKKKITRNIQSQARDTRYEILIKYCMKNKINTLVTAHNLEDQVETFFIRLSRGSGLKGLSSMSPLSKINKKISLFRPLLDIKKKFLIKISKIAFGKYFEDPSNKDKKYLRTKIRNLKKHLKNSGIEYDQIIKSINNLAISKITLEEYFKKIFAETIKNKKKEILVDLKKFKKLNYEIKIAIINRSIKRLRKNYYNHRSKKVIYLIKQLEKASFKKSTLGGCLFFIKKDNLCIRIEKT